MIDDFGPDFDEEGQPLEEGESDRVKSDHEHERPGAPTGGRGRGRRRAEAEQAEKTVETAEEEVTAR